MSHFNQRLAISNAKNGNQYFEDAPGIYSIGDTFEWTDGNSSRRRRTPNQKTIKSVFTITGQGKICTIYDEEHPDADKFGEVEMCRYYGTLEMTEVTSA